MFATLKIISGRTRQSETYKISHLNVLEELEDCLQLLSDYHHFHYYATFLFKTPLSTLQYASVNHTLYGKCVMLPQLN